jgi:hypothetical protein
VLKNFAGTSPFAGGVAGVSAFGGVPAIAGVSAFGGVPAIAGVSVVSCVFFIGDVFVIGGISDVARFCTSAAVYVIALLLSSMLLLAS